MKEENIKSAEQVYLKLLESIKHGADVDSQLVKYLTNLTLDNDVDEGFSPDLIY